MSDRTVSFEVLKTTPHGRLGVIHTTHGIMETPGFFFCATHGALRGSTTTAAKEMLTQGILSNTYHLMEQAATIGKLGGLHTFLNWQGPIMTDSGGYQIFSLGHGSVAEELKRRQKKTSFIKTIDQDKVVFKHMRDGSLQELSPAKSMQIQRNLGADLIFVLDECTPFHVSKEYTKNSLQLTKRWAELSLEEFSRDPRHQGLYGIVQGSVHEDLRIESIEHLNSLPFFGYGIGGSLGENRDDMMHILRLCHEHLLPNRPVHLLGIGKVQDILEAVRFGIDTFDCVHPTRIARHAGALVKRDRWTEQQNVAGPASTKAHTGLREHIVVTNAQYKTESSPIDTSCECYTCKNHSLAYLHHLFHTREMLGISLLMYHNMFFMNSFMKELREALAEDKWHSFYNAWKGGLS